MKSINGFPCRRYGSEYTYLTLSEKAEELYSGTDPMIIWERDVEDIDDGEVLDITHLYTIRGTFETTDRWMTEDELNSMLEELADDLAEEDAE